MVVVMTPVAPNPNAGYHWMKPIPIDNKPVFAMIQIRDLSRTVELVGERKLHLMDAALMLALIKHTHTYSGRVLVTVHRLALDLKMNESDARAGIARLIKHHQLRRVKDPDTGEKYYRLNPWMVQTSKGSLQGLAQKEFMEA